jgi:hypothetical protein
LQNIASYPPEKDVCFAHIYAHLDTFSYPLHTFACPHVIPLLSNKIVDTVSLIKLFIPPKKPKNAQKNSCYPPEKDVCFAHIYALLHTLHFYTLCEMYIGHNQRHSHTDSHGHNHGHDMFGNK